MTVTDVIDKVKETKCNVETSYWLKHNGYQLPMSDKHILLDTDAWLSDSIIAAAQVLLKEYAVRNIEGLPPPCLGQMCAFHDGSGHWLAVSTMGRSCQNKVFVFETCPVVFPLML